MFFLADNPQKKSASLATAELPKFTSLGKREKEKFHEKKKWQNNG